MQIKWGVCIDLPDDKLPGFYAQIVKALAGKANLFDRDKELLVLGTEEDQQTTLDIMDSYKVPAEPLALLLLPESAETTVLFSDYGFESRLANRYLYANQVRIFRFADDGATQAGQAVMQMQEHLLARFPDEDGEKLYAVSRQLDALMSGIARAYRCELVFVR
ncbi:hypothetical protein B5M42_022245 [Paenibacillus athensensis]|uniref:Uncharacterized protein n=1 Tax=Paenibacillus athensensis TaxID=1967502 RepID=A0A4Y8PQY6_9BACL|nr:hypothetical protein [Paenibacillus athensensis]MCD1261527.1 hypothetical protein [Paenibacillus athensensis]